MKNLLSPLKRIIFLNFILFTIFAGKECGCGNESSMREQSDSSSQGHQGENTDQKKIDKSENANSKKNSSLVNPIENTISPFPHSAAEHPRSIPPKKCENESSIKEQSDSSSQSHQGENTDQKKIDKSENTNPKENPPLVNLNKKRKRLKNNNLQVIPPPLT